MVERLVIPRPMIWESIFSGFDSRLQLPRSPDSGGSLWTKVSRIELHLSTSPGVCAIFLA